ncbi:SSB2 [Sanghuangporus weigelae]
MYSNDYSAGGFMQNSSPRTSSQNSPGGERRVSSQSLRPVTIKQVLKAEQAHSDAELYIDGAEVTQVTVVAQVVSTAPQTTNKIYVLEDGTGRVEARVWTDTSMDEMEQDDDDAIRHNTYVRVTGVLKHFGNKRYINATNVRPIKDAHELYFHLMETMFVALAHQRGSPTDSSGTGGRNLGVDASATMNGGTGGNYSHYTSRSATSASDQYAGVSPLARRIVEFIATQPATAEGVHVARIAREVKADAGAISAALDELMDNGHVYSTVDESHFAVS